MHSCNYAAFIFIIFKCWGVTAGKASHNASNASSVTAGKMGHNYSTLNHETAPPVGQIYIIHLITRWHHSILWLVSI